MVMLASDKKRAIGVFDSGIGGLTAVKELIKLLPYEDIIYLGDTARVPYGTKSRETIIEYARQDFDFLNRFDVKMIIAACGTVSSVIAAETGFGNGLYTGVIIPAVEAALAHTKNKRIGVIGTSATIRSGSYRSLINEKMPDAEVFEAACPMFVPLVENGYTSPDCQPCVQIAGEYLAPLKDEGVDTLILGCTHYPMISQIISNIMGDGVELISSGGEAGKYAYKLLSDRGLLNSCGEKGRITLYCTDSAELFRENARHFLEGMDDIDIRRCSL